MLVWSLFLLVMIPASQVYVRNKERSAKKAGFLSETVSLSESISEED